MKKSFLGILLMSLLFSCNKEEEVREHVLVGEWDVVELRTTYIKEQQLQTLIVNDNNTESDSIFESVSRYGEESCSFAILANPFRGSGVGESTIKICDTGRFIESEVCTIPRTKIIFNELGEYISISNNTITTPVFEPVSPAGCYRLQKENRRETLIGNYTIENDSIVIVYKSSMHEVFSAESESTKYDKKVEYEKNERVEKYAYRFNDGRLMLNLDKSLFTLFEFELK